MLNGSSAYGNSTANSVTGADKPPVSGLVRWVFPAGKWQMRP